MGIRKLQARKNKKTALLKMMKSMKRSTMNMLRNRIEELLEEYRDESDGQSLDKKAG